MITQPKRGQTFAHPRFLSSDHQPIQCVVTAIRRDGFYYRYAVGGCRSYVTWTYMDDMARRGTPFVFEGGGK